MKNYYHSKLFAIVFSFISIALINVVSAVNLYELPSLPGVLLSSSPEVIPDPELIESIAKIVVEILIGIVTIIRLVKRKK